MLKNKWIKSRISIVLGAFKILNVCKAQSG